MFVRISLRFNNFNAGLGLSPFHKYIRCQFTWLLQTYGDLSSRWNTNIGYADNIVLSFLNITAQLHDHLLGLECNI